MNALSKSVKKTQIENYFLDQMFNDNYLMVEQMIYEKQINIDELNIKQQEGRNFSIYESLARKHKIGILLFLLTYTKKDIHFCMHHIKCSLQLFDVNQIIANYRHKIYIKFLISYGFIGNNKQKYDEDVYKDVQKITKINYNEFNDYNNSEEIQSFYVYIFI